MLCDYPDLYDYGYESSGVGAYLPDVRRRQRRREEPDAHLRLPEADVRVGQQRDDDPARQAGHPPGRDERLRHVREEPRRVLPPREPGARPGAGRPAGRGAGDLARGRGRQQQQRAATPQSALRALAGPGGRQLPPGDLAQSPRGRDRSVRGRQSSGSPTPPPPAASGGTGHRPTWTCSRFPAPGASITFRTRLSQGARTSSDPSARVGARRAIPDNSGRGHQRHDHVRRGRRPSPASRWPSTSRTRIAATSRSRSLTPWGASMVLHPRNQGGAADNIQRTIRESDLPALATLRGRGVKARGGV